MSFSSKIVDGGQLQWPIFEHVVFQEWKNKIIKASCWWVGLCEELLFSVNPFVSNKYCLKQVLLLL
jgi:hypothetical protein